MHVKGPGLLLWRSSAPVIVNMRGPGGGEGGGASVDAKNLLQHELQRTRTT